MRSLCLGCALLALVTASVAMAADSTGCIAAPKPPKLPMTRVSGRDYSGSSLRVIQVAGIADTWKPTRRKITSVPEGTMVEVLEDLIVVDAPDIVWVSRPIEAMNLKEGDTILRYARLGKDSADLWAEGCWYKEVAAEFITDPDGTGCGGSHCSAKVTKLGRQMWWFRIRLPNGKTGWMLSQGLDLSSGG